MFIVSELDIRTFFFKVRVKLRNLADLDFDLDPNWGITPNIETLYKLPCLPDTKKKQKIFRAMSCAARTDQF